MNNLHIAVVIPCLNEQETLINTCISLGFGLGTKSAPRDTYLFLVDNGSTDNTVAVAREIQDNSPEGAVIVGHESERGYVPPRHRGNLLARELAISNGWNDLDVLVIQADADTLYSPGYVDTMRITAIGQEPNVLIESCSEYPPEFVTTYPQYIELCDIADRPFIRWLENSTYDVIVDDKTCSYRLHDYFEWGGHKREYDANGEEIYSETTRLYMRSQVKQSFRLRVESTVAYHSTRKILIDPLMEFATTGFPRADSWKAGWQEKNIKLETIADVCANSGHLAVQRALSSRQKHIIVLFGVLPFHVARAIHEDLQPRSIAPIEKLMLSLPLRDKNTLLSHPGILLTDVLTIADQLDDSTVDDIIRLIKH